MGNVFDYITWRGDLTFSQTSLNEVDNLIFCRLSYLPLDGIVSEQFSSSISIKQAAEQLAVNLVKDTSVKAKIVQKEDVHLLKELAKSNRFGALQLCGYVNQIDYEAQKQFSCITIQLDQSSCFLAYRGTDNTLVGWKEDFNMAFLSVIPAQLDALQYLEQASNALDGMLYLGGHSKGGNLAVYASVFSSDAVRARIAGVYSNDSPGFQDSTLSSGQWLDMRDRMHSFVPQSSVIGMLLEHEEDYTVIHSTQHGLFQHDLYSWSVSGGSFVHLETVNAGSNFLNRTLKDWIAQMSIEEREQFTNTLFEVISATNVKTLQDLMDGGLKNAGTLVNAYKQADKNTRQALMQTLSALFQAGKKNWRLLRQGPEKKETEIE